MRRKWLALLCAILLLSGCVNVSDNVQENLDTTIANYINGAATGPNYRKTFYAYYAEPSVGRIRTNQTSSLLTYNGISFVMNLNISQLISNEYYSDSNKSDITLNESLKVAGNEGTYVDYNNAEHNYQCNIYLVDSGYFLEYISDYVTFYVSGNKAQIMSVLPEMIKISKSIEVEQNLVIATYSSKETIEYTKKALELFQVVIPENGRVDEMIQTVNGEETAGEGNNTPVDLENNGAEINNDNYQTDNYGQQDNATPESEAETEPENVTEGEVEPSPEPTE